MKYGLIKYPTCISFIATGKCVPLSTFLCIILIFCKYQPVLVKNVLPDCLYWLDLPVLKVLWKRLIGSLICSWNYSFLKWRLFFEININFWINIYMLLTFWLRNSYWLRWRSVSWIRKKWNVFDHWSSVNCFCTRAVYWLH